MGKTEVTVFLTNLGSGITLHLHYPMCHSEFLLCSAILKQRGYAKASELGGILGPFFGAA